MNDKLPTPDADFSADKLTQALCDYIELTSKMEGTGMGNPPVLSAYTEMVTQIESANGKKLNLYNATPEQLRRVVRNAMVNAVRQWLPHDTSFGPYSRGK